MGGGAQSGIELIRRCDSIGRDDAQHGGQRRREHACALGHSADVPFVRVVQRRLLRHGIGGHDRVCRVGAAGDSAGQFVHHLGDTGDQLVHGQAVTDKSGRTDSDLDRARLGAPITQCRSNFLGSLVCILESTRARAGVRAARVEHHRAQLARRQDLLRPEHRSCLDLVQGEDAGSGQIGSLVEHQCEVRLATLLDTGSNSGTAESGRCGDALRAEQTSPGDVNHVCNGRVRLGCVVDLLRIVGAHGATPTVERPAVSGRPRARFIDCTAPPAVPLVRLSIAEMTTS